MKLFAKKSFVGVDLGSHRIKVVQFDPGSHDRKITRFGSCSTPEGAIKDGLVLDVPVVAAALRDLLKKTKISATSAVVAAAGGTVFVRPVAFPKVPEAVLRKSIRIEAGRYMPGAPEDNEIEFEILGELDENKMNVLIVSASKDVVATRVAACETAGLTVEIVELEPFALYRALIESDESMDLANQTIALVDVGASMTNVSLIHNGTFVVNRTIPNGGRLLTDALKSYFKLEEDDAEQGKTQLDARELLDDTVVRENPPLRIVQPHLDDLVREIRRSLNYFQAQQSESGSAARKVSRIVMAGGGAKLTGLAAYMEKKLGVPISCAGIFEHERFQPAMATDERGLDLAVAMGLAMRASFGRAA